MTSSTIKTDSNIAVGGLRPTMSFIAIWPNLPQTFTMALIWFVYFAGFFISISASFAGAIMVDINFERTVAVLGQAIPMSVITAKYGLFKGQIKPLKYFLRTMEEDWEREKRSTGVKDEKASRYYGIMLTHARIARIFFNTYIGIVMICWALFVIAPLTRKISATNQTRIRDEFPMSSWYPLPTHLSPIYEMIYVFEVISGTGMVIAHTSIDGLLVASIFHLCGQFEILRCFIEEFRTKGYGTKSMGDDLKFIVERHLSIINASRAVEESFNHILLGQLLGGTFAICLAGFSFLQAMESNNATALIRFGFLLTMALQQMFIYSLAGDYLTSQGAEIRMAAYKANWYELPPSVSKSFLLIMMRASKPIMITAGKFVPMSLINFTGLLKSAASYLSVMRAMNTDKFN